MKFTFKNLVMFMILAVAAFGCETREQWFTKNDGLWNVVSMNTKVYEDSVFVSEETRTDSLGQMLFETSGQGYRIDFAGNREEFTWSLNAKDDKLTLYFVSEWVDAKISGQTKNAMTLSWTILSSNGPVLISTDHISKLERD